MKRGDIYRSSDPLPERGYKAGYYVVVSRDFIAGNPEIETVICCPIYSKIAGIESEVVIGTDDGWPRTSGIRCDFATLLFKRKLRGFAGSLSAEKLAEVNAALRYALALHEGPSVVIS